MKSAQIFWGLWIYLPMFHAYIFSCILTPQRHKVSTPLWCLAQTPLVKGTDISGTLPVSAVPTAMWRPTGRHSWVYKKIRETMYTLNSYFSLYSIMQNPEESFINMCQTLALSWYLCECSMSFEIKVI